MRAVMYDRFGDLPELREVPDPDPPAGGVVVAVRATGLCRSDWHGWRGHDPDIRLPHVPGHEFAGQIAAIGAGVRGWQVGERVTAPFICACGNCPACLAGDQQVCHRQEQPGFTYWGSFADLVVVPQAETNLVRLTDGVDYAAAATLGCRFATAFRAVVHQGRVRAGEWVAVYGCGGVGLSAVMIAVAAGARVVAVDISADALALARRLGASATVNASPGGGMGSGSVIPGGYVPGGAASGGGVPGGGVPGGFVPGGAGSGGAGSGGGGSGRAVPVPGDAALGSASFGDAGAGSAGTGGAGSGGGGSGRAVPVPGDAALGSASFGDAGAGSAGTGGAALRGAASGGGVSAADLVREITAGGAHLSIDALGSQATLTASVEGLRRRGRHVQVGLLPAVTGRPTVPMELVVAHELEILGSHGMPAHAYRDLLPLVETGALRPAELITEELALPDAAAALAAMDRPARAGIQVIVP